MPRVRRTRCVLYLRPIPALYAHRVAHEIRHVVRVDQYRLSRYWGAPGWPDQPRAWRGSHQVATLPTNLLYQPAVFKDMLFRNQHRRSKPFGPELNMQFIKMTKVCDLSAPFTHTFLYFCKQIWI